MFIRGATRKYKGKSYTNYSLVESYRTDKGPRQRTICSLGDLKPRSAEEWLQLAKHLEASLSGQATLSDPADPEFVEILRRARRGRPPAFARPPDAKTRPTASADEDVVAVRTSGVKTENHREAGPVHVGLQFWQRLGLDEILAAAGLSARTRLLTLVMTLNRLIAPKSEHAMPDWVRRMAIGDIVGVDLEDLCDDALYRNLDRLYPARAFIEQELVKREKTLYNLDQTIFLYDLTSTYFEGQCKANGKARLGHSRDMRSDCKQVVIGLVVNRDGFPIAHEIHEGNAQDRKTLEGMLDLLDKRVGLQEGQTVVVDRGMAFDDNLEQIRARKLHYLVASRQPERAQWLADFEDADGFTDVLREPSPRNPGQKKTVVRVKRRSVDGEVHALCIGEQRIEKDRAIRAKQEGRLLADLARLKKRVDAGRLKRPDAIGEAIGRLKERYPRVARYYPMAYDVEAKTLIWQLDENARGRAEKLDGAYLLKTDRTDLSAEDVWRIYSLLTRAEDAFRDLKSPLAERPIFHHLEHRVDTHIFLCILAYHLLVAIEKTLLDQGLHTSWSTVRETLSTHQVCTVVLPTQEGPVLRIRKSSSPEREHAELYRLLDVPDEMMRPVRTWSTGTDDVVTEKTPGSAS